MKKYHDILVQGLVSEKVFYTIAALKNKVKISFEYSSLTGCYIIFKDPDKRHPLKYLDFWLTVSQLINNEYANTRWI